MFISNGEKLLNAVVNCDLEAVKKYSKKKNINLEFIDDEGKTPLGAAISRGFYNISVLLINAGAKIDIKNDDSDTPLSEDNGDWIKINNDKIAYKEVEESINREITQIFNLKTMTVKETTRNMDTNAESSIKFHFSKKAADKSLIIKAAKKHQENNGSVNMSDVKNSLNVKKVTRRPKAGLIGS